MAEQYEKIFAIDPTAARQRQNLAHHLPQFFTTLEETDYECEQLREAGKISVIDTPSVRASMDGIKNPSIPLSEFRRLANIVLSQLAQEATYRPVENKRAAISVRAGLAFQGFILKFMPEVEIGFATQTRDEETAIATSYNGKLGSFEGTHAFVFDPMLATGGSMLDMVNAVVERGAEEVTTVSAFTTPQGLVAVSQHPAVSHMITTPLEAGLNDRAFIVGAHQPYDMLGDFGDRYFGQVSH